MSEEIQGVRPEAAPVAKADRIETLDFIRGIAVMGILAANIISFGQPFNAAIAPSSFLVETGDPDGWMWIAQFVLIDGKMRGLFTLLFGAGMYLFMERAWARGSSRWLQIWRLFLLLVFGLVHFFFIWIGDILAMYALIGFVAVAFIRLDAKALLAIALSLYGLGAMLYATFSFPYFVTDTAFGEVPEMAEVRTEMENAQAAALAQELEPAQFKQSGDYLALVADRISEFWFMPFSNALVFTLETLPLMLLGMALYRYGFFSGAFARSKMVRWGWIGLIVGGVLSFGLGRIVQASDFSYWAGNSAFLAWSPIPRFAMVMGLAALLVSYSPAWTGWFAQRVRAAGRAAFTNYLGTSIVMLFIMHGWALGLFGKLNRPELYLLTAGMWVVMLAWSKPWLDRFRYGPLEWLWRCLTYRKRFALKR